MSIIYVKYGVQLVQYLATYQRTKLFLTPYSLSSVTGKNKVVFNPLLWQAKFN